MSFAQNPDRSTEFKQKFRQALEINAKDEIAKLVRSYSDEATNHMIDLCFTLASGGSAQVEKEMGAFKEAWRTAFKSELAENMYNFFSLLDPRSLKELDKLRRQYDATWKKYSENLNVKDSGVFQLCAGEFETLGRAYAEIGYQLFAARSHNLAAQCLDTPLRGAEAELDRAADNYGACVAANKAFDVTDGWAVSVKGRFDQLTREGHGAAAPAKPSSGGGAPPAAPTKAAEPISSALHFEPLAQIDAMPRPNYSLDDVHVLWPIVYMREKGTSGTFMALSKKVKIVRTGSAGLMLDLDGDDKGDQEMPASGNKALVRFTFGEGDAKREWAVVTEVGTDKEAYQGLQVNVQPTDRQFVLYVMAAASMVGSIAGVPVRVFDDNMDGEYGSAPKSWQYVGLSAEMVQPDVDSIQVGQEKRARPWSEYVDIGGAWYQLTPENGGAKLNATPTTLPLGKLKLDYKGETPEYAILQGEGPLANTYIDLMQNGGAEVTAPAGKYKLFMGIVRKGKKQQVMKALILPGKRTPGWTVEEGKTTAIAMGAPFGFDFASETKDGKVTVKGPTVVVTGSAGERYERLWNCTPRPEMAWRKAGTKKGSKPERLPVVENLNEVDEQGKAVHEYADTFHPLDLGLEVKLKEGEAVEVQLTEKKNKLFGAIESAWRS